MATPDPLPPLQAIGPVVSDTEMVGERGPDVMRSVVVLTRDPQPLYVEYPRPLSFAVPRCQRACGRLDGD